MSEAESFDSWAILELMGHVRTAGRVTEEERFGAKMGRIDIPMPGGGYATSYFTAASIYRLTPCTEAIARAVAARNQAEPVHRYELPALTGSEPGRRADPDDDDDPDDDLDDVADRYGEEPFG